MQVSYAEGVRITEHDANWNADKVVLGDPAKNRQRIQEAVQVARQADAVVLVIGTNESTSREAWADNHLGDVADLSLMSQQDELADAMLQTGKPVVVVLINGRPLAIPTSRRACPPSSRPGTSARRGARRSARCCSATSTPAANCR